VVHALPSLQEVPFGATGFVHSPVIGSIVPARWQASEATQVVPASLSATICITQAPVTFWMAVAL
jgi:hypothetical protein